MNREEEKFIRLICAFEPEYNCGDRIWEFYPKTQGKWFYLRVQEYQNTYYLSGSDFESFSISSSTNSRERKADPTLSLSKVTSRIREIYRQVRRNPIAYHGNVGRSLSPKLRQGVIARKFVKVLIPDYMRFDREFTDKQRRQILALLKTHRPEMAPKMTSRIYFKYCRIAYLSNPKTFRGELNIRDSGKLLYARWADGRDSGLKDISPDSEAAFRHWYEKKSGSGGHPWEIYRGGNSTHIDLAVVRDQVSSKWRVVIHAFSSTRLAEACKIALALKKARLPFEIADQESYLLRMLGDDWVGIVPEGWGLRYAWQEFPKEFYVSDCIHFVWFKDERHKSLRPMHEIKKLITWFPIRPLFLSSGRML